MSLANGCTHRAGKRAWREGRIGAAPAILPAIGAGPWAFHVWELAGPAGSTASSPYRNPPNKPVRGVPEKGIRAVHLKRSRSRQLLKPSVAHGKKLARGLRAESGINCKIKPLIARISGNVAAWGRRSEPW